MDYEGSRLGGTTTGAGSLSLEGTLSGLGAFHLDPRKDCEKPQLCGPIRYFREVGWDVRGSVSVRLANGLSELKRRLTQVSGLGSRRNGEEILSFCLGLHLSV